MTATHQLKYAVLSCLAVCICVIGLACTPTDLEPTVESEGQTEQEATIQRASQTPRPRTDSNSDLSQSGNFEEEEEATSTPRPTHTPRHTAEPQAYIIEYVEMYGGVEVYPLPDTSSGRIFAAVSNFTPHVAGKNEEETWLYILYFDGGLQDGWTRSRSLPLSDSQLRRLAVIDPENPPNLPETLSYNQLAARPFGTNPNIAQPTDRPQATQRPEDTPRPEDTQAPPPTDVPQQAAPEQAAPAQPTQNRGRPRNCAQAREWGLSPQEAAQWSHLDRDNDGVACYGD